jgi:hypothetical protein
MTPQQRDAYVIEKLGIDGWEPGRICENRHTFNWWCEACGWRPVHPEQFHPHDIPPPNLRSLEGMAKLIIALRRRGLTVDCCDATDDLQDALADAAYKALEQDPK